MLLKILLFVFLDGYCISCTRTERFLSSRINDKTLISKEEKSTNKSKTFLSTQKCFNEGNITFDSTNEKKYAEDIEKKRSISRSFKRKHRRHKRFKLNGRANLSGLVEQSFEFDESPPVKRDLYLYKEIFSPWEYSQLQGNYFNVPFFENRHDDENYGDHIREKRFPRTYYSGDSESQFTSDQIDEYINLKTGERTKQKVSNLEKAFQQLEQDITKLAKLKSMTAVNSKSRNKLSLNLKKDNIEMDSRIPSNIEHLDREIMEEVLRVDVPKVSKSPGLGQIEKATNYMPILKELLNHSFQASFKNNMMENGDKKTVFSPKENSLAPFNIRLNKTNQNGEDK